MMGRLIAGTFRLILEERFTETERLLLFFVLTQSPFFLRFLVQTTWKPSAQQS